MAESLRLLERLRSFLSSFPRTRESSDFGDAPTSRHSREGGNPETSGVLARKALDARLAPSKSGARLRGNDEQEQSGETQKYRGEKQQSATPVYIAAKRGEPKRRNGAGDGR